MKKLEVKISSDCPFEGQMGKESWREDWWDRTARYDN
jgi:hypothetical protein